MKNIHALKCFPFKFIILFSLAMFLTLPSISAQQYQLDNWEAALSKVQGQNRLNLIETLTNDLIKIDLSLTDSLAKAGIALAEQLGDSLSKYRIGINQARVHHYRYEPDRGLEWAKKSLNYFVQAGNLTFDKVKAQLTLAYLYIRKQAYVQADSLITESKVYLEGKQDAYWQAQVQLAQGHYYLEQKEYKTALDHFSVALASSKALNNIELIARAQNSIGAIKGRLGLYPEALELHFEVFSMDCSPLTKAYCYSNISHVYYSLEDWDMAMKYEEMSLELKKKIGFGSGLARAMFNIGLIHKKQLNFGEALKYYEQSLAIQRANNMYPGSLLATIGNIYNQLGEPDKANEYFDEYMELALERNDWEAIWSIHYNKAYYFYHTKQYEQALSLFLKSFEIAEERQDMRLLEINNDMLSQVYMELGNKKKAVFHREQHAMISDSLNSLKRMKKIGALEQKHLSETQEDGTASAKGGFSGKSFLLIGALALLLLLALAFLFFKNRPKPSTASAKEQPLEAMKIEEYFEKLFARLDQNGMLPSAEQPSAINGKVPPVNDMADFLKTNLSQANGWASFEHYFSKVHKDFFKTLKSSYPTISTNELNMCALLKLNLRNKDIAQIMGISPDSVRKAQTRLSKKLELNSGEVLRDFVLKI